MSFIAITCVGLIFSQGKYAIARRRPQGSQIIDYYTIEIGRQFSYVRFGIDMLPRACNCCRGVNARSFTCVYVLLRAFTFFYVRSRSFTFIYVLLRAFTFFYPRLRSFERANCIFVSINEC